MAIDIFCLVWLDILMVESKNLGSCISNPSIAVVLPRRTVLSTSHFTASYARIPPAISFGNADAM